MVADVAVKAQSSGFLHYRWGSSDGTIVDQDSSSTTWTLPKGPGIHSAYVLVSNGLGGYTEARVVVNTDTTGIAPTTPAAVSFATPASAVSLAPGPFRLFSSDDHSPPPADGVYLPDSGFVVSAFGFVSPATGVASSDLRGEVVFPSILPGSASTVNLSCAL